MIDNDKTNKQLISEIEKLRQEISQLKSNDSKNKSQDVNDSDNSEQRLNLILENSRDVLYQFNLQTGTYDFMSPSIENIVGISVADYINGGIELTISLLHPDDVDKLQSHIDNLLNKTIEDDIVSTIEYRLKHPRLGWKWLSDNRTAVYDKNNKPIVIVGNVRDITEHKKANEKNQENELRFRNIVTNCTPMVFMYDSDGTILLSEGKMLASVGVSPGELVGQNVFEIYNDYPEVQNKLKLPLKGELFEGKVEIGDMVFEAFYSPNRNADGEIIGVIGMALDVTEKAHFENNLKESESHLRQAQVIAKIGSFEGKINEDKIWWSPGLYDLFGLDPAEFIPTKESFTALVHPDEKNEYIEALENSLESGKLFKKEFRGKHSSGEWRHFETVAPVFFDENNQVIGIRGTVQDINEHKQIQNALNESKESFREIVEGTGDLITVVNTDGDFLYVNYVAERIFGIPADQCIHKSAFDFTHVDDKEKTTEWFKKCIAEQVEVATIENRQINIKTGTSADMLWKVRFHYKDDGKVKKIYGIARDITNSKILEKEFKDSEEKNRLLVENSPYCIHQISLEGQLISMNPAGLKMIDADDEKEIIGLTYLDYVSGNDKEKVKMLISSAYNGIPSHFEFDSTNEHSYSSSFIPIHDEDKQVIRLMGITRDITDRKVNENELAKHKQRLIDAQTIAKLGHYVFDFKDGIWTSCEILNDIFGMDKNYVKNINGWLNIVHPDYRTEMYKYFHDDILTQHKKFDKEYKIVDVKTGVEKWVHGIGHLKFDDNNNPIELFGAIQDISERRRNEEKLQQSEEKFRKYISHAPNGIFILNEKAQFLEVNKIASEMTGYTESELLNLSITDITFPEGLDETIKQFYILRSKGSIKGEYRFKQKDESVIWVSLNAVTLSENRFMAFCSDITETKRLQEQESRAERLETAGTIAGQVAHDFNNLLAPLMAYPELIRDHLSEDHLAHKYINDIENAATKIADINQQLLSLGRRGHYNLEVLDLNSIVQQALNVISPDLDNITVSTELDENLMFILGGGSQIHRVITNLFCNAVDALHGAGNIIVKSENFYVDDVFGVYASIPIGEYVKLSISDTGCGIPSSIIQKVLDPFFTTKTSDKIRGSGLGLSIVDAVLKDHKGFLDIKSQEGNGTAFYLYFPTTRKSSDQKDSSDIIGGNESVLVIDDDKVQRQVSKNLLEKLGYNVNTVESGEKAIELLKENPYDILILDMIMPPGIDGTETYMRIIEFNPNQKAVIVSGYSESERVKKALELGAGSFVKKPLTKKSIALALRTELDKIVSEISS